MHLAGTVTVSGLSTVGLSVKVNGNDVLACPDEAFTLGPQSNIQLPGKTTAGDCLHDGLKQAGVELKNVHYNPNKNPTQLPRQE